MLEASQKNTRYKSAIEENAKFLSKEPAFLILHTPHLQVIASFKVGNLSNRA